MAKKTGRSRPLRAVLYSQWFPPEKAGQLTDIADALVARGIDVSVVTGFPNYPTGKIYEGWRQRPWKNYLANGYRVKRVIQYPSHDASAPRRTLSYASFALASTVFGWRALRRADVVYVYHPPLTTALGPWLSRKLGGAPYVLHVQDLWPDSVVAADMLEARTAQWVYGALSHLCNGVYRAAAAVIAIAPTMAELIAARGRMGGSVSVVSNWTDESVFAPGQRSLEVVESLGLRGKTSVMFAGNIGAVQSLETAIRAAAQVKDLGDFRLVLVGDGVRREALEKLAATLEATNVLFLGARPFAEMNAITAAADAQLVILRDRPHLRGTIPSKLASVMASGLPVVCAVEGDARACVETAQAGWTCESDNVEALASVFRAVHAADPAERARRGASGRAFYEREMARSIGVDRIVQILGEVAGKGRTTQARKAALPTNPPKEKEDA